MQSRPGTITKRSQNSERKGASLLSLLLFCSLLLCSTCFSVLLYSLLLLFLWSGHSFLFCILLAFFNFCSVLLLYNVHLYNCCLLCSVHLHVMPNVVTKCETMKSPERPILVTKMTKVVTTCETNVETEMRPKSWNKPNRFMFGCSCVSTYLHCPHFWLLLFVGWCVQLQRSDILYHLQLTGDRPIEPCKPAQNKRPHWPFVADTRMSRWWHMNGDL